MGMNVHAFDAIADSWQERHVLVAGDIIIDKHIYCKPHKLSQEAPVQVLKQGFITVKPGGAANVAVMCAALGAKVSLFGRLDNGDEPTEETVNLLEELEDAGIDTEGIVQDHSANTPIKTRIWAAVENHYHQLLRIDDECVRPCEIPAETLRKQCAKCKTFKTAGVVIISDYAKGFCTSDMFRALPDVESGRLWRYVDPPDQPAWWDEYRNRGCDYFVTNRKKAFGIASCGLAERLQAAVVTTSGSSGCDWSTKHSDGGPVPTRPRYPVDVTGCGDQFLAVFAMTQFVRGMQLACEVANVAAGLQAMRVGCEPVTVDEIRRELIPGGL
jgi:D-beta-D-heptose 7-phosphate kinase/D-beta-D-heptose 1-phosphate adenosyltransferase